MLLEFRDLCTFLTDGPVWQFSQKLPTGANAAERMQESGRVCAETPCPGNIDERNARFHAKKDEEWERMNQLSG
jgi:hypothetical protein